MLPRFLAVDANIISVYFKLGTVKELCYHSSPEGVADASNSLNKLSELMLICRLIITYVSCKKLPVSF